MPGRIFALASETPTVIIRHPPNWTAIGCFGGLAALHLALAATAMSPNTWEAQLSACFGAIFAMVALAYFLVTHEIALYSGRNEIGILHAMGPIVFERCIPFSEIESVQIVLPGVGRQQDCAVSIVCRRRQIELPPSANPRQDALALSMLTGSRLVKIYTDPAPEPAKRIDQLFDQHQN